MTTDTQTADDVTIEYGDQFRHIITDEVRTVHDARQGEEKVIWSNAGWDYRDELIAAINGEPSMYEVEALGDDTFDPY